MLAIWFLLLVVSTGIALGGGLRINLSGSMSAGCYLKATDALSERSVGFRSLTEALDTGTAGGKLIFHIPYSLESGPCLLSNRQEG